MKTNYIMIDMENVVPDNLELLDQDWVKVLLFVGKNQTKLPISIVKAVQRLGSRAQYVQMSGTGHNALDFHIAFYIGRIAATDKDAYFHIISNDTGFDPLIAHLKQEHVLADRVTGSTSGSGSEQYAQDAAHDGSQRSQQGTDRRSGGRSGSGHVAARSDPDRRGRRANHILQYGRFSTFRTIHVVTSTVPSGCRQDRRASSNADSRCQHDRDCTSWRAR